MPDPAPDSAPEDLAVIMPMPRAPTPAPASGAPPSTSQPSASHYVAELPLPEELQAMLGSGYVVEAFLGQGGMGAVYKGLQMPLRRPVAIKILAKRNTASGGEDAFDFEERFKREAYAMAALTHPHIVQVYDCGDAGEHHLYISMELVEGGDLSEAIKSGQMTPERALKLIPQICDGLQAAHERGIVHRDIKPANIFLTIDGRAKVADFGLAKKFDAQSTFATKTGMAMGTPDYAAPEQFDAVKDIDHRADIYSLGVMMYQMLTGTLPRGSFRPASQRVGTDPRLDAVLVKAMENEREDRYQSVAEIKAEVQAITAGPASAPRAAATRAVPAPAVAAPSVARPVAAAAPRQPVAAPVSAPKKKSGAAGVIVALVGTLAVLAVGAWLMVARHSDVGTRGAAGNSGPAVPRATHPASESSAELQLAQTPSPPGGVASAIAPTDGLKPATTLNLVTATKDTPFMNTLGMRFVPVPITGGPTANQRVLFSIWETRAQDYAAYAQAEEAAERKVDGAWKTANKHGVPIGREPDHPVAGVNWEDAQAFCRWLTAKEQAEGKLPSGMVYRLPSDHEWSCAVGLGDREDAAKTPEEKQRKIAGYPWGGRYPPKSADKAGNYADESFHGKFPVKRNENENRDENPWIEGYEDGYATTAPVGSFPPNKLGLYDLGGNVREWCEDWYNAERASRVSRGGSWYDGTSDLLSSLRRSGHPTYRSVSIGFRCVLVVSGG